ncbi:hypothetical protein G5C65_33235, partial [Streptomyces sp. SB3404]|nr:hypothetical protein [Streptomyces boncukensis]
MNASADPVRGLLHQLHDLCAHAVDPLEIAAALEARGLTDRAAARFRHRDVFSLAEELYARTPRPALNTGGPCTSDHTARPGDADRPVAPPAPGAAAGARARPSEPAEPTVLLELPADAGPVRSAPELERE